MVETALVMPVFLLLLCGLFDFGRYVYVRSTLNDEVIRAARHVGLRINSASDCAALNDVVERANGIIDSADPHSVSGNLSPTAGGAAALEPSIPPTGQGYVYIYPAVATANPPLTNCTGAAPRPSGEITVQTTYSFEPWTPMIKAMIPAITIYATSSQNSEY
jgi:hypothetical protein